MYISCNRQSICRVAFRRVISDIECCVCGYGAVTINYKFGSDSTCYWLGLVDKISRMNNCITAAGRWACSALPLSPSLTDVGDRKVFTARCYSERGYATVCRLSACPSVLPSICDVQVPWSYGLEYFENNFTADWLKVYALADPNMGDLVQREHPQN